jgi:hypothetical protein
MFGSSILDVAIGMAVVYLLLSLIASAVQEAIAAVLQARSANLLQGLHSLFSGDMGTDGKTRLLSALYDHGLIRGLYRDPQKDSKNQTLRKWDKIRMKLQDKLGLAPPATGMTRISNRMLLPAYIPSRTFALALIDIVDPAAGGAKTDIDGLRTSLATALKNDVENKALQALAALADSAPTLTELQTRIEHWYDDAMDRVSGWYKKYTQNILMIIGLLIALAFNVNSIRVAATLWTDKDARQAMVALAQKTVAEGNPTAGQGTGTPAGKTLPEIQTEVEQRIKAVQDVADTKLLPLGWTTPVWGDADSLRLKLWKVLLALIGWSMTALALSLGASFWFDTLNKFMVVRGTIKPDEKSPNEPSKG